MRIRVGEPGSERETDKGRQEERRTAWLWEARSGHDRLFAQMEMELEVWEARQHSSQPSPPPGLTWPRGLIAARPHQQQVHEDFVCCLVVGKGIER